jgi:hypothetical protein
MLLMAEIYRSVPTLGLTGEALRRLGFKALPNCFTTFDEVGGLNGWVILRGLQQTDDD